MKEFTNKTAVITGAAGGLGRGIAFHCASLGMNVVLADINEDQLRATCEELGETGANVLAVATDMSDFEDVKSLAFHSFDRFGSVDLLINNAGVAAQNSSILDSTMQDWDWVMGVNFYGTLYALRAFVPRMKVQDGESHVVNVASLGGIIESVDSYHVSKSAVVSLTEALFHELADGNEHVKTSVYIPGLINTELYNSEQTRPERFENSLPDLDLPLDDMIDFFKTYGFSVEKAVKILFQGIRENELYIGASAYQQQSPLILDVIKKRFNNIVTATNPEHPLDLGPTNPVE